MDRSSAGCALRHAASGDGNLAVGPETQSTVNAAGRSSVSLKVARERSNLLPFTILYLEGESSDSGSLQSLFTNGNMPCTMTTVRTHGDLVRALEGGGIDLIIAAASSEGLLALKTTQSKYADVPFIVISKPENEQLAIEALKDGATDYVLKENLARLIPAVQRALREATNKVACRRLGEEFIQLQKMDVVGQLAGGIAHDFNNILSIILGYSDLIKQNRSSGDKAYQQAEKIQSVAQQAIALTRQLLTFSRKENSKPVVLDLNEVLHQTEQMLQRLIRENIAMTVCYSDDLWNVKADAGSVCQVLMNLVVNARDAMPRGGKLTIETRNVTLAESRPGADMAPGDYVVLLICDSGIGMTPEVKAHLFDPFFTTKAKDRGTGLGLSICETLTSAYGGHIEVESEVGLGSTFKVYFPRVTESLPCPRPAMPPDRLPSGTETLLVVEDEPDVRHLAVAVLEAQGYNVLRSPNGQDALRVVKEHSGGPIKLVVSDVIMPQMGGKVMAEWLKTIDPTLKILFTSGYNDNAIAQDGILDPAVAYLPKPYTSSSLTQKVRAVLDSPNVG